MTKCNRCIEGVQPYDDWLEDQLAAGTVILKSFTFQLHYYADIHEQKGNEQKRETNRNLAERGTKFLKELGI